MHKLQTISNFKITKFDLAIWYLELFVIWNLFIVI